MLISRKSVVNISRLSSCMADALGQKSKPQTVTAQVIWQLLAIEPQLGYITPEQHFATVAVSLALAPVAMPYHTIFQSLPARNISAAGFFISLN